MDKHHPVDPEVISANGGVVTTLPSLLKAAETRKNDVPAAFCYTKRAKVKTKGNATRSANVEMPMASEQNSSSAP